MDRREFLSTSVASGTLAALGGGLPGGETAASAAPQTPKHKFKLRYAPHFGMFKNHAPGGFIDELKFAADEGFTAWEDNGMRQKPKEQQEQIAKEMARLGILMGVFVATGSFKEPTFAVSNKPEVRELILKDIRDSLDVAKRVNAKWCTVVPGLYDLKLHPDYQLANVIDMFKRCAELCEKQGLVMVMEPLNTLRDHPGVFLQHVPQAYQICKSVGSPSCKILYDMYHAQIQIGNIIPNIDAAWDESPYFQIGDHPGRKEPTTGEMNYRNIFKHIHAKGFTGVMGMEHGNFRPGKEGERALIDAYIWSDSFDTPLTNQKMTRN
jgi:hydroxypyruvate isomerase